MLAVLTKLHLAYPLPLVVLAQVLSSPPAGGGAHIVRRLGPGTACCIGALATLQAGSAKVNWHAFIEFWSTYAPGRPSSAPAAERLVAELPRMAGLVMTELPSRLREHLHATASGLFTLSEAAFLAVACIGFVLLYKERPLERNRLPWVAALCAGLLPVVAYRGVWHYYFVYLAFAAIGFAYAIEVWMRRHGQSLEAHSWRLWRAAAATVGLHAVSVLLFGAAKLHDVASFRDDVGPYLSAIESLPPGARVAIVSRRFEPWQLDGGFPNYLDREQVGLTRAFESRLYVVKRADRLDAALIAEHGIAAVVDASSGTPRLRTVADFLSRPGG
jgi:hypothetical protein